MGNPGGQRLRAPDGAAFTLVAYRQRVGTSEAARLGSMSQSRRSPPSRGVRLRTRHGFRAVGSGRPGGFSAPVRGVSPVAVRGVPEPEPVVVAEPIRRRIGRRRIGGGRVGRRRIATGGTPSRDRIGSRRPTIARIAEETSVAVEIDLPGRSLVDRVVPRRTRDAQTVVAGASSRPAVRSASPDRRIASTCSHTAEMTTDPSPTAEATRLTESARTSPTTKIPSCDVA